MDDTYGGDAAIIPGTNLVAGWFWWKDKIVAGVVDLEKGNFIRPFEKAGTDMLFPYGMYSSINVAPDGSEATFELVGRNEHLLSVWNLKSGKLVYGHNVRNSARPPDSSDYESTAHVPNAFAWHPQAQFVALALPSGITELRHGFANPPFARLEGIMPSRDFSVQDFDEPSRVIIGNAVVDTSSWETIITLPPGNRVSPDGDLAVIETRKGVIDVIRLGLRKNKDGAQSFPPLRLKEWLLLHQLRAQSEQANR